MIKSCVACHAPQGKFRISDLLRSFLIYSGVKFLNLAVFGGRRIKGVPALRVEEAAKQLVIRVRRWKISALIRITYRHPYSCRGSNA